MKSPDAVISRRSAEHFSFQLYPNSFFPAAGPATRSFNGLHPKSKFLAFLKSPDGKLATYPKTNIKSATKPIGVMSPMKQLLTLREMRDLVAFLSTLKGPN